MSRAASGARSRLLALEIAVPILAVLVWWFASTGSTNPYFPPLSAILERFRELWLFDHLGTDVWPSVANLLVSFFVGSAAGIALGVLLGLVPPLNWLLNPAIQFVRAVPAVALLPIFIAIFGFGNEVRVFMIAVAAFFPVLISTVDGIRAVDDLSIDVARVYRLPWFERLRSVYLPATSPQIFAGMQVGLQVAFIVMITSEMLGAVRGIGAMTIMAQRSFDSLGVWAGIVLLGVLGYLLNLIFALVRRRALAWHFGAQRALDAA
jgi:ABC-type nitrate/sulfonate/bicarbonate transport system permease component